MKTISIESTFMSKTETEQVTQSLLLFNELSRKAFRAYTDTALRLMRKYMPLIHQDDFDAYHDQIRTAKGILSQAIGAASKSAKGTLIKAAVLQLSSDLELNLSTREVQKALIHTVGRSVAKKDLVGLFNREDGGGKARYSLYYTDCEYRESIHNLEVLQNLKLMCDEFDCRKVKQSNPFQSEITDFLKD